MTNTAQKVHDSCCCECSSGAATNKGMQQSSQSDKQPSWKKYIPAGLSLILLVAGLIFDNFIDNDLFTGYISLIWYSIAYIPVGFPVLQKSLVSITRKDFFNEFTLMTIATLGAFFIGEYPEGVAVMLFYSVGELFQESAVNKARGNIKSLLDITPRYAVVLRNGQYIKTAPEGVEVGETIQVKAGEKVPLDGVLLSPKSSFNTSALTGESKPGTFRQGETVLAGMLNIDHVIEIKVAKIYSDSSLAKILEMVQNATSRKAKTELLIRRLAKIYTPVVFFLAVAITFVPFFILPVYVFETWLYRALIFLVVSCPCALVISIPLGYFGGIGAASRHGILFKGANYMDIMNKVNTVVMDKTGTLTRGVFEVKDVFSLGYQPDVFMGMVAALESHSNHPVAKAIVSYNGYAEAGYAVTNAMEISGYGMKGEVSGKIVLAGNARLMQKNEVTFDKSIESVAETVVMVAIDNVYSGYITIADKEKDDASVAVKEMYLQGVKETVMLSGDKTSITRALAKRLGIDTAFGDLLPEDKVEYIARLKEDKSRVVAFVGDGINDSPSLALSDVGIAMGGLGSDAAIEVADVIIQNDQPSKVATAIKISKDTRRIVIQNIVLAFGVKLLVLLLGAMGYATMWGAVFADVGVALLAILNAVRILRKNF